VGSQRPDLNPARAALQGSSALDLGWLWDLGTGNIAYHDIHHFNANIPSYRLRQCHSALRDAYEVQTIRWPEALRSFTLKLWDEDEARLVPFPKAARNARHSGERLTKRATGILILAKQLPPDRPRSLRALTAHGFADHVPVGRFNRPRGPDARLPGTRWSPRSASQSAPWRSSFVSAHDRTARCRLARL
jgi:hypothetical protein